MIQKDRGIAFFSRRRRDNKADRPRIKQEMTPTGWLLEAVALVGLLTLFGYTVYHYRTLPDTIPSHFNGAGAPDDYSGKGSVWFMPGVGLFVYLLLTFVAMIPHQFNFPVNITPANAARQYAMALKFIRYLKGIIMWLFFFIIHGIVAVAKNTGNGLGLWFLPLFLGAVFIPMIIYFISSSKQK